MTARSLPRRIAAGASSRAPGPRGVMTVPNRRRRRIPVEIMAERASISRTTLNKVEKGDPGVSMGIYARVLFVLGMAERLADLADVTSDALGLELEEAQLPKRIRRTYRPLKPGRNREE